MPLYLFLLYLSLYIDIPPSLSSQEREKYLYIYSFLSNLCLSMGYGDITDTCKCKVNHANCLVGCKTES